MLSGLLNFFWWVGGWMLKMKLKLLNFSTKLKLKLKLKFGKKKITVEKVATNVIASCQCQSTVDACIADARAKRYFVDLEAKNFVDKPGVMI